MDLQALKVFQTVAKQGSFSKAARELNYAQSNITTKIQQLESQLETVLFYRHNRGVTLTVKGKTLLNYAEKIFRLIEETDKVMKDAQTPQGPLLIGSMETTAAVRLPPILAKYHQNYPDVDITLKTGPTEEHIQAVLGYELDGAFTAGPVHLPELNELPIFEEELVLITNRNHPPLLSIQDVQTRTLLVFRTGCSYRARLEQWLNHERVIPNKIMEFGTLEAIIGCVSAGLGISLLPYSVISKHVESEVLQCHQIPAEYRNVKTVFIYRKDSFIPASLVKFIDMFPH